MEHFFKATTLAVAAWLAAISGAWASGTSVPVDKLVNDCVYKSGVRGTYHVAPVRYGGVDAVGVPAGLGVSQAQSQRINTCIASAVQRGAHGAPQVTRHATKTSAVAASTGTRLTGTEACLAAYKHKLRTTQNGRDYYGDNVGTQVFSGLFGPGMGRQLIEYEYDRCLDRVTYLEDRCPTGVMTGGDGYCIRRPRW